MLTLSQNPMEPNKRPATDTGVLFLTLGHVAPLPALLPLHQPPSEVLRSQVHPASQVLALARDPAAAAPLLPFDLYTFFDIRLEHGAHARGEQLVVYFLTCFRFQVSRNSV